MTQVNVCLKRTFTFFNILFAILGALVIGLALVSQSVSKNHGAGELEGRTTGLLMLYIVGSVTMMIAILGAYGAHKENKGALIAFLVFMVIGTLIMWKTGTSMAISSPQIENVMEQKFRSLLPLDQSPASTQNMMSSVQTTLQCCGLFSYEDWENNIPSSCACNSEQEFEGNCRTVNYNEFSRIIRRQFSGRPVSPSSCSMWAWRTTSTWPWFSPWEPSPYLGWCCPP
ncbi:unnamed protein product [Gadus morhua 'NCC']